MRISKELRALVDNAFAGRRAEIQRTYAERRTALVEDRKAAEEAVISEFLKSDTVSDFTKEVENLRRFGSDLGIRVNMVYEHRLSDLLSPSIGLEFERTGFRVDLPAFDEAFRVLEGAKKEDLDVVDAQVNKLLLKISLGKDLEDVTRILAAAGVEL